MFGKLINQRQLEIKEIRNGDDCNELDYNELDYNKLKSNLIYLQILVYTKNCLTFFFR